MTKFLDYKNPVSKDNRIYSEEDLNNMSKAEIIKNYDTLTAQSKMIGFPKNFDLAQSHNTVYVHSYFRQDGTFVHGYWRSVNRSGANEHGQDNNYIGKEFISDNTTSNNLLLKGSIQENNPIHKTFTLLNHILNYNKQDAKYLMDLSLNSSKKYENNSQYIRLEYKNLPDFLKSHNLPMNLEIPKGMDGIIFSKTSELARNLSNNQEVQSAILSARNPVTGAFNSDNILVECTKDKNLAYAIGHATVFNPHTTKDNYIEGILFDIYDFNYMSYRNLNEGIGKDLYKDLIKTIVNNCAYSLQKVKMIENYYFFVPIRFKLSK